MRLFFGVVVWVVFCIWIGVMFNGCAGQGKQERWEWCAGVYHQECLDVENDLDCEYEFYKECVDE